MRKLIVNADDFGLTRDLNKGIIQGYRLGVITSATALVNMPHWQHAAELAERFPGLGVGLHFNLTSGPPVTKPEQVPSLVDQEGLFKGDLQDLAAADAADIARELYNQYNRLLYSGVKPTHIDSHEDIHNLDNVLAVVLNFAAQHDLPVRLVPQARGRYSHLGTVTTAALIDDFQERGANKPNFERLLQSCRANSVELRCHPGMVDSELENISSYTWQRERELAVICAYSKENLARELGFTLIPFSRKQLA